MTKLSRLTLQPAYVLHQRPYRDSSAIIELFTLHNGRVSVVARGLRRPKSRLVGLVQALQPLLVSWTGKGELGTLTKAETQGRPLKMALKNISCGLYLNELIIRLVHRHEAQIEIFSNYDETLRGLSGLTGVDQNQRLVQVLLRRFEVRLLKALGYGMILDHEVKSGEPIDADRNYQYVLEQGPVLHSNHLESRSGAIVVSGKMLLALASDSLSSDNHGKSVFREAKYLTRTVLDHHLGGVPINSRKLFSGYTDCHAKQ